ncbi:trypsin-like isoform X2 [Macrobrachium rosenbergii]|uniref:trypsin-like isoform X2 n=1 Tax=Macrobrachium rosenbergii TaxID=79674 RepID=UPI0034D6C115
MQARALTKQGNLPATKPCGRYVLQPGDVMYVKSMNYPRRYPRYYRCKWVLKGATDATKITVTCDDFILGDCRTSHLEIADQFYSRKFCGNVRRITKTSLNSNLRLIFRTGQATEKNGRFLCRVSASGVMTTPTTAELPQSSCRCGRMNSISTVVGEVDKNEYPWQVGLVSPPTSKPFCGGSIISDQWILTAAHCVQRQSFASMFVVIGEHNWNYLTETNVTERRPIVQIAPYPDFDGISLNNDLALVKLASPINFPTDNRIAPVCLPPPNTLFGNVNAVITGWGLSQGVLREHTVTTLTNSECSALTSGINQNKICTKPETGKNPCQGNSGGPMITASNGGRSMIQIGVMSSDYDCSRANSPGVLTRVNNYLAWIQQMTAGSSSCPPL